MAGEAFNEAKAKSLELLIDYQNDLNFR